MRVVAEPYSFDKDSLTQAEYENYNTHFYFDLTLPIKKLFCIWEDASNEYGKLHNGGSKIDSIYQTVFYHFADSADKRPTISLPMRVEVRSFNSEWKQKNTLQRDNSGDIAGIRYYIPHLETNKTVLYDLGDIHNKICHYLGGVEINGQFVEVNRLHWKEVDKYVETWYGHWGGYWHLCTMPIIDLIDIYQNGCVVALRTSWNTGCSVWIDTKGEMTIFEEWIE